MDAFFHVLAQLDDKQIVVDFSGVRSISRSFAHQYQIRKKASKKKVTEIHVPAHVAKMFAVVRNSSKNTHLVDSDSTPLVTI